MALGLLRNIKSAFTNLNPEKVRVAATREIFVGLVADGEETYAAMEDALAPPGSEERGYALAHIIRASGTGSSQTPDILLYEEGVPAASNAFTFYLNHVNTTVEAVLDARPDLEFALARTFPAFRNCVVDRIIQRTSRENALFSIVTALPDIVPSLIELPWAVGEFASDTAFLTVNQIRMSFEIAAVFGRDIGYQHQKAEIAGIIASAFGWRAIARQFAGKVPLGGGLVLKGAIAYAGTYVVGRGLQKLMNSGVTISSGERKDLFDQAYETGKRLSQTIAASLRRSKPATEAS